MAIQYPSIVVQNHRYRGPMESKKGNDFILDTVQSIQRLKSMFRSNEDKLGRIKTDINLMDNEDNTTYQSRHNLEISLASLKGGELR